MSTITEPTTEVWANTPAYSSHHVIDTKDQKGMTVAVALRESGLDFEVEKVPALAPTDGEGGIAPIDGYFAVRRKDTGVSLGVVGRTWQPVQNHEGFKVLQDVIEQADERCMIEAAGAFDGGKKVWILAHIDEGMQIAGEAYKSFLLFTNGHNGRTSVTAAAVDMRMRCSNFLIPALRESDRVVRVRHTSRAAERVKEARHILGMRNTAAETLAKQGEWLAEESMSEGAFEMFLESLLPCEHEEGTPAHTMITERRSDVMAIYSGAANLDSIRGTKWGAYNAVAEYSDHGRAFKNDDTQLRAQFGITPSPLKQQAMTLLLPAAR